jgi:dihydrofolate reductase
MRTMVYVGTSLDGFIARNDGDIDWLVSFANEEAIAAYREFISRVDAIVIGRGTFEKVLGFPSWPYEKDVFVLSNTIKQLPAHLHEKVTLLVKKPSELLTHLSQKGFSALYIDGARVIQSFLEDDLIDELTVSKVPVLIGSGIKLFSALEHDVHFDHIRTQVQTNGLVRSYYLKKGRLEK